MPELHVAQIKDNVCVVVIDLLLEQCPVTFHLYIVKHNGLPIEAMTVDIKFFFGYGTCILLVLTIPSKVCPVIGPHQKLAGLLQRFGGVTPLHRAVDL